LGLSQVSHPFVIVNSEDVVHAEQVKALGSSDEVVLTMRMDVVSLHRAKQHVDYMIRNRVSPSQIHVVAMGTGTSGELPVKAVKQVLGTSALHCVPDDQAAVTMSINVGNPLVQESPKSKASRAIIALADALTGNLAAAQISPSRSTAMLAKSAAMLAMNSLYCK
jgi:pilus assembly protein CpaE